MKVIGKGLLRGAAVVGGIKYFGSMPPAPEVRSPLTETENTTAIGAHFEDPFYGQDAKVAARELGIDAGSFLQHSPNTTELREIKDRIDASPGNVYHASEVVPIFPQKVLDLAPRIERLSQHPHLTIDLGGESFQLPPNVTAAGVTIESGGVTDAVAGDGEVGSMQVIPELHFAEYVAAARAVGYRLGYSDEDLDRYVAIYNQQITSPAEARAYLANIGTHMRDALKHPDVGLMTGMLVLKKYHQKAFNALRSQGFEHGPNHPTVWEKTIAMYNSGPGAAFESHGELPDITQKYVLGVNGLMMSAELAGDLQQRGVSRHDIPIQLYAPDVKARIHALREVHRAWGDKPLSVLCAPLTTKEITADPAAVPQQVIDLERRYYLDYMSALRRGQDLLPMEAPGLIRWHGV